MKIKPVDKIKKYWWKLIISIWYALGSTFRHKLNVHAASCTYYFLVSMVPATVLIGWLLSNILIQTDFLSIFDNISFYAELQKFISSMQSASSSSIRIVGLFGVMYGLWSASSLVRGISGAFNVIFDSPNPKKKLATMVLAYFFIPLFLVAMIIMSSLSSIAVETIRWIASDVLNIENTQTLATVLTSAISAACIALAAYACFFFLAPERPGHRPALIGSLLFASYFYVLQNAVIAVMANLITKYSVYGALGTLLVILLWAFLVFYGLFVIAEYTDVINNFNKRNYYNYVYIILKDKPNLFERFILRRKSFGDDYLIKISTGRPYRIAHFKALVHVKSGTITVNKEYTIEAGCHKIISGEAELTSENSMALIVYEKVLSNIVREHPDVWRKYWGNN